MSLADFDATRALQAGSRVNAFSDMELSPFIRFWVLAVMAIGSVVFGLVILQVMAMDRIEEKFRKETHESQ